MERARQDPRPLDEGRAVLEQLNRDIALARFVGQDRAFLAVVQRIPLVASAPNPVLILGETGTGKELCARAIHHLSRRQRAPFIPVDCGALPDHLLENELFGHVRGAFTDAHHHQRGLVGMAKGGTLFLDEIDSLSPTAQGKLLRLLQENTFKPLGADQFECADVRIIAATNSTLEDLVATRRFRADLYFRLNVLRLIMPPLRDRRSDIPLLAEYFVRQACTEAGVPRKTMAAETLSMLTRGDWPGNIRELQNVIQRAVVFAMDPVLLPEHLSIANDASPDVQRITSAAPSSPGATTVGAADTSVVESGGFRAARARVLEAFERSYVANLLQKHNGNVTQSAREAQTDRRAFGRLVKRYRIGRRSG